MSLQQPPIVHPSEVDASLYRPYKLWSVLGHGTLRVILVKREQASCIAACPALGLRCEAEEYLDASSELSKQVCAALSLADDTSISATCSPPFSLTSSDPLPLAEREHTTATAFNKPVEPAPSDRQPSQSGSNAQEASSNTAKTDSVEIAPGGPVSEFDLEMTVEPEICTPAPAQKVYDDDEDQLDLFG